MKRFLVSLSLVAALLCVFLGIQQDGDRQGIASNQLVDEHQLQRYNRWQHHMAEEPQGPTGSALRSSTSSHRVASSRSVRLLPVHGGKPGSQHTGRWTQHESLHLIIYKEASLRGIRIGFPAGVTSPRHYYVIALRRLLC